MIKTKLQGKISFQHYNLIDKPETNLLIFNWGIDNLMSFHESKK